MFKTVDSEDQIFNCDEIGGHLFGGILFLFLPDLQNIFVRMGMSRKVGSLKHFMWKISI